MKVIKTASGKKKIKISKKEWQSIGKTAGWMKIASSKRSKVIRDMQFLLGANAFIKTSEEFDPNSEGGIWFSNEEGGIDDMPLYDNHGETDYKFEAHPKLQALMDKNGWFIEPYDSGTLMAFPA